MEGGARGRFWSAFAAVTARVATTAVKNARINP